MLTIDPKEVSTSEFHAYLLGAVIPRPIAFASTVDSDGRSNLSPFSFFNCFGANPPLLIFSPARSGRDNTTKHTYDNVISVGEVAINIVNYSMVQQTSLASTEYPQGMSEFRKAGFTEVPSVRIKPPRVGESPVVMECKVLQVIPTGDLPASGNLVICEVLLMHIREEVLDGGGSIDPFKLDAVARLGRDWYCRVQGDAIFKVPKPSGKPGIGFDGIPKSIRNSKILTGNDLALLASVEKIPDAPDNLSSEDKKLYRARRKGIEEVHKLAQEYIRAGKVMDAWKLLLGSRISDGYPPK